MKHRSVIAFILLAAALFAAPQISNDLSALKSALGARIRGEILHAFLNLRASDAANELVTRPADPLLASYTAKSNACPLTQATAKKSDNRAQVQPRAEAAAKSDAGEQFAMLIDPTSGVEIATAALSNVETRIAVGEAATLAQGDIAMLNAPDAGVDFSIADALMSGSNDKDAAKRWRKSAEKRVRVAYVASGLEKFDAQKFTEATIRRIGTTRTDDAATRAMQKEMRVKLLKVRGANRGGGGSKIAAPQPARVNAPLPVPVAALVPPALAPLPPGCATAGE
jgi:hypothetical protein